MVASSRSRNAACAVRRAGHSADMIRILFLFAALFVVIALITRTPGMRRAFYAFLAFLVVYAILKATGVIDAWAPDRMQ